MPNILNASACPVIQQPTAFLGIAASMTAANAPGAECTDKSTTFFGTNIQPHATRLDILSSSGGANACAIISRTVAGTDLQLVAPGSGLLLTVKQGQCIVGTIKEVAADTTISVPDNTTRVWIWLLQTGALDKTTTTTPSATPALLLGSCVTSGGNITAVDTSGVLYLRGGQLIRYSADPGVPTDTPPANILFRQVTAFGSFDWDGTAYRQAYKAFVTSDPTSIANGMEWMRTDTLVPKAVIGGVIRVGAALT